MEISPLKYMPEEPTSTSSRVLLRLGSSVDGDQGCLGSDGMFHKLCTENDSWILNYDKQIDFGLSLESTAERGKCLQRRKWKKNMVGLGSCGQTQKSRRWMLVASSDKTEDTGSVTSDRWLLTWTEGRSALCMGTTSEGTAALYRRKRHPGDKESWNSTIACRPLQLIQSYSDQQPSVMVSSRQKASKRVRSTTRDQRSKRRQAGFPYYTKEVSDSHKKKKKTPTKKPTTKRKSALNDETWLEPKTGVTFPTTLGASYSPAPEIPLGKSHTQVLIGGGCFLKYMMPVYAIAIYVSAEDEAFSKALDPWRGVTTSADLVKDPAFYEALGAPAHYDRTIIIRLAMSLDKNTLRNGMMTTWQVMSPIHKRELLEASYRHDRPCCEKGTELAFTWRGKTGHLEIRFNGLLMETILDPNAATEAEGRESSTWSLPRALWFQYLAEDPQVLISAHAKRGFTARVPDILVGLIVEF
uniref:Chalcone isomerase domain-containing protein n=1 Tax=Octactis speculum TaxID=3111310 RepID=A0A7S2FCP4_9STRA